MDWIMSVLLYRSRSCVQHHGQLLITASVMMLLRKQYVVHPPWLNRRSHLHRWIQRTGACAHCHSTRVPEGVTSGSFRWCLGLPTPLHPVLSLPITAKTQGDAAAARTATGAVSLKAILWLIGGSLHVRRNDAKLTSSQERVTKSFQAERGRKSVSELWHCQSEGGKRTSQQQVWRRGRLSAYPGLIIASHRDVSL